MEKVEGASQFPGVNVMLMGPAGTGKTHSIGTLVETGIEVFYFAFESGTESLLGFWADRDLPIPANLHIIRVKTPSASWLEMADSVNLVNKLSYEALKKVTDPNKSKYNQFEKFLRTFNDVVDDKGGRYGCVDSFGVDKAIVIDGLTGLGNAAMKSVVGGKADRDQKDWGLAQNLLENFLRGLCDNCICHTVLIAHVEREVDVILGGTKISISTLGVKLPPKLPPMFSDVILCVRNVNKWYWDVSNPQADVKTRNLPLSGTNPQDFALIIDKWRNRAERYKQL